MLNLDYSPMQETNFEDWAHVFFEKIIKSRPFILIKQELICI